MKGMLTEELNIVIGLIIFSISFRVLFDKKHPKRWTTAAFWAILGFIFTLSNLGVFIGNPNFKIPSLAVGYLVLFTIIMGNAFAVITAGIGLPFVIAQGGDPVIVGILGLTAGYCGTLLTPMAANFNVVSATVLEMKNKQFGVIKYQAPVALLMWVFHVIAMYVLAF